MIQKGRQHPGVNAHQPKPLHKIHRVGSQILNLDYQIRQRYTVFSHPLQLEDSKKEITPCRRLQLINTMNGYADTLACSGRFNFQTHSRCREVMALTLRSQPASKSSRISLEYVAQAEQLP